MALAEWVTSKDNPFFAKSTVNRVWSYFFGRGIIDPVDDIRASNPPSNPALLDALTKDFIDHNFDLRQLMRDHREFAHLSGQHDDQRMERERQRQFLACRSAPVGAEELWMR